MDDDSLLWNVGQIHLAALRVDLHCMSPPTSCCTSGRALQPGEAETFQTSRYGPTANLNH